jgi:hypothetical protein
MKKHGLLITIASVLLLGTAPISAPALTMSGPPNFAYHIIFDYTQGDNLDALVTNTQDTTFKSFPLNGTEMPPVVAINPNLYPSGYAKPTPDLYIMANTYNTDVLNPTLTSATDNTCDQGLPARCPGGNVPITFVHRLGTYDASTGLVTPLSNAKLAPTGQEKVNDLFSLNGQAFDMDRIRYAANRLWDHWRNDKMSLIGWATRFKYQPTGTMSFETFIDNIVNGRTMYGIVRVVIPIDMSGEAYLDPAQPVNGAEFPATSHTWAPTIKDDNLSLLVRKWSKVVYKNANPWTTINVYGMLLFDYVNKSSYDPDHFLDQKQDYVNNYASVAAHDSASHNGQVNVILPRSRSRHENLQDDELLNINPTWVNTSGRVDSANSARTYMVKNSTAYVPTDVSDASVYEYWMRKAVMYPVGNATRTAIINDLTGVGSQYDYKTQTFNGGASRRSDYDSTEWAKIPEKDQFHAYFPNGYEHGWMVAFDALRMADLDATTTEKTPGSWWMHLTDNAIGTDVSAVGKNYPPFGVPNPADAISVDADGDGTLTKMPNFFSTGWEDLPAFAFAGGLLDVHAFANISGMLYTPDSCEIESNGNHTANESGAQEYISGAIIAGNGIWLGGETNNNTMIAISYNFNSFDRLRHGPILTVKKVQDIRKLKGL